MVVRLGKSEISMLVSLVTLEIEKRTGAENSPLSYCQRLRGIRDKLLAMLTAADKSPDISGDGLPEFREYARRKYPELDGALITIVEDLIERQREKS